MHNSLKITNWNNEIFWAVYLSDQEGIFSYHYEFVSYYLRKLRMISLWVFIDQVDGEVDGVDKRVKTCSGR